METSEVKLNEAALGRVPSTSLREAVRGFAEQLVEQFGSNVLGLSLYGPVLEANFDESGMAAATVLVLRAVDLSELRRLGEQGARHGRRGIAAPLIMTPDFIGASGDSYPLELLEIQQNHATLVGRDHFASLELKAEHVRLQCERELKRIGMRMPRSARRRRSRRSLPTWERTSASTSCERSAATYGYRAKKLSARRRCLRAMRELAKRPLTALRQAIGRPSFDGWEAYTALYEEVTALEAMANRE
jgi:hypothetical protein